MACALLAVVWKPSSRAAGRTMRVARFTAARPDRGLAPRAEWCAVSCPSSIGATVLRGGKVKLQINSSCEIETAREWSYTAVMCERACVRRRRRHFLLSLLSSLDDALRRTRATRVRARLQSHRIIRSTFSLHACGAMDPSLLAAYESAERSFGTLVRTEVRACLGLSPSLIYAHAAGCDARWGRENSSKDVEDCFVS